MHAQLLSNGRHTVMLTGAGSGFSRWRDLAITRWREDPTGDGWGSYVLLRDVDSGAIWSAGMQPCGGQPDEYAASLSDAHAHIVRREGTLVTTLEVAVASSIDAELRRLTIVNHGDGARTKSLRMPNWCSARLHQRLPARHSRKRRPIHAWRDWSAFAFALLGDGNRAGRLFTILNPISHSNTPDGAARYKVEPYVACADVYSVAPHVGRGGWTWYTGSGGWLYRAGLEAILGFKV